MKKWLTLVAAMVVPAALAGCAASLVRGAKEGDVAALQQQLDAGADINESGVSALVNGTPLSHAAYYCHPEAVRYLLQKGANVESSGGTFSFSTRPLHWAAAGNCKESVRLLLDAGADINAKADYPWAGTPLGIAAENGNMALIEYLMARGADVDRAIAGLNLQYRPQREAKALLEEQRQKAVVEAARKAAQRQAEEKQEAIRKTLERADLIELIEMRPEKGLQIEALTQALIRAKNTQLPAFLVRSSVEDRVNLLTAVELRIADAQALVARLNARAEDAVRQGQSAAPLREEAGKVQTYAGILSAIRSLLLQS
jgi:hypothetical protein